MTLNDRISKIIEYSQLTSSEFADEIDVQRSSISHITSGRNKPSLDFLIKVKERFPELNWDWLITGDGEMTISILNEKTKHQQATDLFSIIDDDDFGKSGLPQEETPREFPIPTESKLNENISDSHGLEVKKTHDIIQTSENQQSKVKRIILLYEDGHFETYLP